MPRRAARPPRCTRRVQAQIARRRRRKGTERGANPHTPRFCAAQALVKADAAAGTSAAALQSASFALEHLYRHAALAAGGSTTCADDTDALRHATGPPPLLARRARGSATRSRPSSRQARRSAARGLPLWFSADALAPRAPARAGNAAHAAIRDAWEARAEALGLAAGAAPSAAVPSYAGVSWRHVTHCTRCSFSHLRCA